MLVFSNKAIAQQEAVPVDPQQAMIRRMVGYLEANLNTLGDPEVRSEDKDILITESYKKLFRDALVQIEDDLEVYRSTVTYKDAPSYLLDVDFFFKEARFSYAIQDVEAQSAETGEESWLVHAIRTLEGISLNGDTIRNDLDRYLEINRTSDGLKIVSVYTTKLNRSEANRNWWRQLPIAWKSLLAGDAELMAGFPLQGVVAFDEAILVTASDTFFLPDYLQASSRLENSNHYFFYGDTVMGRGWTVLGLSVHALDAFLEGLLATKELNLEDRKLPDLESLAPLKSLRILNLAGTGIADVGALRSMTQLQELNLSRTRVQDLGPLRFSRGMQKLVAQGAQIGGELPEWPALRELVLSECPLDSSWSPGPKPGLAYLDLSRTGIKDLRGLEGLTSLEYLDVSQTAIRDLSPVKNAAQLRVILAEQTAISDLSPLRNMAQLERLHLDGTAIQRLDDLAGKPRLQRVYCDGTGITDSLVRLFHRQQPHVLIMHETVYLKNWWQNLPAPWQAVFFRSIGFSGVPDKETLHAISALRTLDLSAAPGSPNHPNQLRTLEPLLELPELEVLSLRGTDFDAYNALKKLRFLRELDLSHTRISSVELLQGLPYLETLRMDHSLVKSLEPLMSCPRLSRVFADSTALSDSAWLAFDAEMPNVLVMIHNHQRLSWWTALSEDWKNVLATAAGFTGEPNPENLARIRHIEDLTLPPGNFQDLNPIVYLNRLKSLRVAGNRIVSLQPLAKLSHLEWVDVTGNPIYSLDGLESHGRLRDLRADNTPIRNLDPLARSLMLERLSVAGTEIKNLQPLVLHRRLIALDCSNTRVRSLAPIEALTTLRELIIFNTDLSEGKVSQFQSEHPDCAIRYY
ncbi:MAG: hypothetical protein GC205_10530 [Bacteroidetes bacterium]|nr:hypothetical protein [Bacteroidota bacterium]